MSAKPHNQFDIRIGTAAWTIPKPHATHFPAEGSHLQRYAQVLNCVEINSSFYRPHMLKTWERWAASTPGNFRFAVKTPKAITHEAKLIDTGALLKTFLDQAIGLGNKLGSLLVQLPPCLAFDAARAHEFFTTLRELHTEATVLEPRHATWFTSIANHLLRDFQISRAAADPPAGSSLAEHPGGWPGLHYYRLHGSPRTYYSDYSDAFLKNLAHTFRVEHPTPETWVIFDNTALGHATMNALDLRRQLHRDLAVQQ